MNYLDIKLPPLQAGSHETAQAGLCAMEMVAYIERLPHSDAPACTCPIIAAYVRGLNDLLPNSERNRLLPYLPRLVDTVSPPHERERGEYLAWAAITIFAPAALRAIGLHEHAHKLATFDKTKGLKAAAADAYAAAADAYAAANARKALYNDCFRVLDGVLAIGPQSRGFKAPAEPLRELAEMCK
jgi:hypothetical protein